MSIAAEPGPEGDALVALAVVEGDASGLAQGLGEEQRGLIAQLEDVQRIISVINTGAGEGVRPAPPPRATWGPFRLDEQVGRGTFGAVCRAFDPGVAREIAVKLYEAAELPAEPRLMARVRHPNVITVFGAGIHEGIPGIWMEFVHGRTLAERVQVHGPLSPSEAVRIGIHLCDALEAVHDAHLVHQDVKPRNVMEQDDGRIVLMDFGAGQAAGPGAVSFSVAGTPLYMAPEVVLGERPSAQSDLYSLGVLIYYLLTGTYPFYAADWEELRALHARGRPGADARRIASTLRELRPEVSASLARCLGRALATRDGRYRTAAEFRSALRNAQISLGKPALGWGAWRDWTPPTWAMVVIAAACAATIATFTMRRPATPPRTIVLTRLTGDSGLTTDPARSVDGSLVAYASDRAGDGNLDIWIQQMSGGVPLRVTDDAADDSHPSFSPDGSHIAFRSERDGGGIYVVPAFGGQPRLIAPDGQMPRFSPVEPRIAYFDRNRARVCVAPIAGGRRDEFEAVVPITVNSLTWSTDGRQLLFIGYAPGGTELDWWVVRTDDGANARPIRTGALAVLRGHGLDVFDRWPLPGAWSQNRILFSGRLGGVTNLWEVDISPETLRVTTPPRRVTVSTEDQVQPSLGVDGRLVFSTRTEVQYLWASSLDAANAKALSEPRVIAAFDPLRGSESISRDGRWLVFTPTRPGPMVRLKDLATGRETSLSSVGSSVVENYPYPVMRPDGSAVVYRTDEAGEPAIRAVTTQTGHAEELCRDCGRPTDWSTDGRYVVLQYGIPEQPSLGVLDRRSGQRGEILRDPARQLYRGRLSPDGRWIAFHTAGHESPLREFIAPFRGLAAIPQTEWIPLTDGSAFSDSPRWSPDGNLLYYISQADGFLCIWARRLHPATKRPIGEPLAVQHFHRRKHSLANVDIRTIDMSVAVGKMVFTMGEAKGNIWIAEFR